MAGEPTDIACIVIGMRKYVEMVTPLHVSGVGLVSYLAAFLLLLSIRRLQVMSLHLLKINWFSGRNYFLLLFPDEVWQSKLLLLEELNFP